jgi:hypothetical protein
VEHKTVLRLVTEFLDYLKKLEAATGINAGIPTIEVQRERDRPEVENELALRSELVSDSGKVCICVHPCFGCRVKAYLPEPNEERIREEARDAAGFFITRGFSKRFLVKPDGDSDEEMWYCLAKEGPFELSAVRDDYARACPAFDVASTFISTYANALVCWKDKPKEKSNEFVQEMADSIDTLAQEIGSQLDCAITAAINLGIMAREHSGKAGFRSALEITPPEFLDYLKNLYRECKKPNPAVRQAD